MKTFFAGLLAAALILACAAGFAAEGRPGADRSQQLVVYSNSVSEGRGDWLREKAAEAGFNLAFVDVGGGALTERLIAEKNNPMCDVFFGLNGMSFVRLEREDIMIPYVPSWASEVDMSLASKDGLYHPIVIQPLVMVYNTDVYDKSTAPNDWFQLGADPRFNGKHTIHAMNGATCQTILSSMLVRYRDDNGLYGVSEEGWEGMRKYIASSHLAAPGEDFFGNVLNESLPISQLWGSGLLQRYDELKVTNVDYAEPAVGSPFIVEQVAIAKGTTKPELAKDFIDWFGGAELQAAWARRFGTIPAHAGALGATSERAQEMLRRLRPQPMDWAFIADNIEYWLEKIQLEFVQ